MERNGLRQNLARDEMFYGRRLPGGMLRAEPIKQLKPTGYVNDFAGVVDASSSEAIRRICQQIDQKAKAQIAIVTVHSLDGSDIESYASDLYKAWGIGPKSSNRGILILLRLTTISVALKWAMGWNLSCQTAKSAALDVKPYLFFGRINLARRSC